MNSKVYIEFQKGRKSPYRVKYQDCNVYLSTEAEADRVKKFITKVLEQSDRSINESKVVA